VVDPGESLAPAMVELPEPLRSPALMVPAGGHVVAQLCLDLGELGGGIVRRVEPEP